MPRLALAQINAHVGAVAENADKIIDAMTTAKQQGANIVLFPELALTGYPPEDLLFRSGLYRQVEQQLRRIQEASADIAVVVGHPHHAGIELFNAATVFQSGEKLGCYFKQELPNYGVFDEHRYFSAGDEALVVELAGIRCGVTICEDIWHTEPAALAKAAGAELLLNLNASPFHEHKPQERGSIVAERAKEVALPICYTNLVGGQDELVFDGHSMLVNGDGRVAAVAAAFREDLLLADVNLQAAEVFSIADNHFNLLPDSSEHIPVLYQALVLGVRDYVRKNGFPGVVLGLSGGIDSALCLAIAVDALGADQVEAVLMPSRYTADMSNDDAYEEAQLLGVYAHQIAIEHGRDAIQAMLAERFTGLDEDITEENIQARLRGILLMAISNKTGKMVLTTSNKSETAVGYATLYGDMCGGFAPLKDVNKTLVYELSRYRNTLGYVIPERVITRPPSAELRPDQQDSDSLPPYDILDPILSAWIEEELSVEQIVALGYDEAVVQRLVTLVMRNEYKRRQAAPGTKVTKLAFGRDRRYPVCSGYRPFH